MSKFSHKIRGGDRRWRGNQFVGDEMLVGSPALISLSVKGASIYDVCTRGGGGSPGKGGEVRELNKGGCVKMQTAGGGG